jgi:starch phosphorylase
MRPVKTFHVRPLLPEQLRPLQDLAYNLRWSWHHETIGLFRRLDRDLWEQTYHNPVLMLGAISQERLQEAAHDEAFLAHLDRVRRGLDEYLTRRAKRPRRPGPPGKGPLVAYFSMEFGPTECLPIYSGGLGILAGDSLKSASDLGYRLVGVGLLYQKGYFRQYLSPEGWQQELRPVNDFSSMPVLPFRDEHGSPQRVTVQLGGFTALVQLWRVQVGRVTLVLLDTNLPENPREIQDVTDELYGGDGETRIRQEIVLGVGGMRALRALGLDSRVYHINEGHCSFLALERTRLLMQEKGLGFAEAREVVASSTVFTSHTPVSAGIDVFPPDVMERYFAEIWPELGLSREEFLDLGRMRPGVEAEPFNMAVLALRTSGFANAVSRLHGQTSREKWRELWPGVPVDEVPIIHITNGIHPASWISDEMRSLFDRYLGPHLAEEGGEAKDWERAEQIPGEELWRTHERRRERLVVFVRQRLVEQLRRQGASRADIAAAEGVLDPEALTIGFARRFVAYKRGTLLLRDPDRLAQILNAPGRPVQIIFAGKAHPRDDAGKALIRDVVQLSRRPNFFRRIVFLEDYDAVISRYLVEGVDVWLNTPRRPLEASGTSGMKAAFNGALNLSILDGWWDEAYSPRAGWAIGKGETYTDPEYQDRVEAGTLYEILEHEVVPLFYERGKDGVPAAWIDRMRTAMAEICPVYNSHRMLRQYAEWGYGPAADRRVELEADDFRRARDLARWRRKVREEWRRVKVLRVDTEVPADPSVGQSVSVSVRVDPGYLTGEDLAVQIYLGRVDEYQSIVKAEVFAMEYAGNSPEEGLLFRADVPLQTSGMQGFTVRVLPRHDLLLHPHETGLIRWAT